MPYKLLENRELLIRSGFRFADTFRKWYNVFGMAAATMVTIFRSGNSQLFHREQPFSIVILCVLILTYSIVRYLKKNKYLTEQK